MFRLSLDSLIYIYIYFYTNLVCKFCFFYLIFFFYFTLNHSSKHKGMKIKHINYVQRCTRMATINSASYQGCLQTMASTFFALSVHLVAVLIFIANENTPVVPTSRSELELF